ncbi:hypothetical protein BH09PLA1_BH09PLA1_34890 [soil metagenome]
MLMGQAFVSITGCIASGKSTIARRLARGLRARGRTAAVVDLDLIYEMLGDDPKNDETIWRSARRTASSLASAMTTSGTQFVIVEGEFWTQAARGDLLHALPSTIPVHYITLAVSYPEALRRATADPTRGLSKDPIFLENHYAGFLAVINDLRATDLIFDTELLTPELISDRIANGVLGARQELPGG